jgi:hypothetical protein
MNPYVAARGRDFSLPGGGSLPVTSHVLKTSETVAL